MNPDDASAIRHMILRVISGLQGDVHIAYHLYGPPASGKSSFMRNVLTQIVGSTNVLSVDSSQLCNENYLKNLGSAKVVSIPELSGGSAAGVTKLLSITGSDSIQVKKLYQDPTTVRFSGVVIMAGNSSLEDLGVEYQLPAVQDRVISIRFNRAGGPSDSSFETRLSASVPDLIHWALGQDESLSKHTRASYLISEKKLMSSSYALFATENLYLGGSIRASLLQDCWTDFAEREQLQNSSWASVKSLFLSTLQVFSNAVVDEKRTREFRYYEGITIDPLDEQRNPRQRVAIETRGGFSGFDPYTFYAFKTFGLSDSQNRLSGQLETGHQTGVEESEPEPLPKADDPILPYIANDIVNDLVKDIVNPFYATNEKFLKHIVDSQIHFLTELKAFNRPFREYLRPEELVEALLNAQQFAPQETYSLETKVGRNWFLHFFFPKFLYPNLVKTGYSEAFVFLEWRPYEVCSVPYRDVSRAFNLVTYLCYFPMLTLSDTDLNWMPAMQQNLYEKQQALFPEDKWYKSNRSNSLKTPSVPYCYERNRIKQDYGRFKVFPGSSFSGFKKCFKKVI